MIETRDTRTAREKAEYGERQMRAVAYAAKMGQDSSPIGRMIDAAVKCTKCGAQGVGNCDCWSAAPSSLKFDKKAYQRAYMRRKRAKEKE